MNRLHLVGSVPLDTAQEVLETFGGALGPHLAALPDGEVGPRRHWVSRLHYQVFALHPDLEVVQRPRMDEGVERLNPHDVSDSWKFRVRPGVERIRFGEPGWRLGFAREAVNSYFAFRTLRESGAIAAHLRFQVGLPLPVSAAPRRIFETDAACDMVRAGYAQALEAELDNIAARIPARDLAVQWDCATELHEAYRGDVEGQLPQAGLSRRVPEGAALGFHLCFGTLGGWPRFAPDDLGAAVSLANGLIGAAGRRVDWVHIPVLDRSDDAFFAPLHGLRAGGVRVYLGAIHNMERFPERIRAARRHLPQFGVAAYCGFGRMAAADMPQVLDEHRQALRLLDP